MRFTHHWTYDYALNDDYEDAYAGGYVAGQAHVNCRNCGQRCVWRDEPGKGWRLYVNGQRHVCAVKATEMEVLG